MRPRRTSASSPSTVSSSPRPAAARTISRSNERPMTAARGQDLATDLVDRRDPASKQRQHAAGDGPADRVGRRERLRDVEGQALRLGHQGIDDIARRAHAQGALGEQRHVRPTETLEMDANIGVAQRQGQRWRHLRRIGGLEPSREQDGHASAAQAASQVGDDLGRRRVGAIDVIDPDEPAARSLRERRQGAAQRLEEAEPPVGIRAGGRARRRRRITPGSGLSLAASACQRDGMAAMRSATAGSAAPERMSSAMTAKGMVDSPATVRASSTVPPLSRIAATTASARRVLPMPASPSMSSSRPSGPTPPAAATSRATSESRPMSGRASVSPPGSRPAGQGSGVLDRPGSPPGRVPACRHGWRRQARSSPVAELLPTHGPEYGRGRGTVRSHRPLHPSEREPRS